MYEIIVNNVLMSHGAVSKNGGKRRYVLPSIQIFIKWKFDCWYFGAIVLSDGSNMLMPLTQAQAQCERYK